ncbi:hypothetical protein [Xanthomonas phage BUDD]|nr:hypothetical protein [Xanthomonas phage BUDD]
MKKIWVTFRKAGFHRYPAAGTQGLEDVAYLAHPHRHLFHFKVAIEVFHDDREIEFHQFLNFLEAAVALNGLDYKSCEMIADDIAKIVAEKYPALYRTLEVEVSEDGECGVHAIYGISNGEVFG